MGSLLVPHRRMRLQCQSRHSRRELLVVLSKSSPMPNPEKERVKAAGAPLASTLNTYRVPRPLPKPITETRVLAKVAIVPRRGTDANVGNAGRQFRKKLSSLMVQPVTKGSFLSPLRLQSFAGFK